MPVLLLLDFSNYVFAEMDAVIEAFLQENPDEAHELVADFNELHSDDPQLKAERSKLEYKLRKLLGAHAKAFKSKLTQLLTNDREQLLQPGKQAPRCAMPASTDSCTAAAAAAATASIEQQAAVAAAAAQLQQIIQVEDSVHLVVVTDAGKRTRWKTQQLVVAKAKQLAEELCIADADFSMEAAEAAPQTAAEQQQQAGMEEQQQQQATEAAELQQAGQAEDAAAAAEQLESDVRFRLRGALLFIARCVLPFHCAEPR
jgi:hypothetical protein